MRVIRIYKLGISSIIIFLCCFSYHHMVKNSIRNHDFKGELDVKKEATVAKEAARLKGRFDFKSEVNKGFNVEEESQGGVHEVKEIYNVGPIKNTDKWIIVTSIASPTEDIKSLATLSEWQLLVVADTKTPKDWHLDGVLFLSVSTQRSLGYKVLKHIPYSNYGRKNIGYLYAIQHGAKVIYETDDDNHPTDGLKGFITTDKMYGVVPTTNATLLNPYAYYGQPTTWPRGYPLENIGDNITSEYDAVHWNTALIQQGAVHGDPDVDAIYRLTRKSNSKLLNLTYDDFMPPLIYPKYIFVPWNSQNTLFHYDAFWGLILPVAVTSRVTDIWRSYFTQTLLWLIDGHLSYMPPNCYQFRNYHSYIDDAKQEEKLYYQAGELVKFLSSWKCESNILSLCIQKLADAMADKGFWEILDAKLIGAWLQDLVNIGYKFPVITKEHLDESVDFPITLQSDNRFPVSLPSNSKLIDIGWRTSKIRNLLYNTCYMFKSSKSRQTNTQQLIQPNPILLLIIFKTPVYESVPYLEALYDGHFVKTIYCGPEKPRKSILREWKINFITFKQTVNYLPGSSNYECLLKVLKLGLRVEGILTIADDAIMKVKAIAKLPLDEVWFNARNFQTVRQFSKIVEYTSKIDMRDPLKLASNSGISEIASVEQGNLTTCNMSNLQGKCEIITRSMHFKHCEINITKAFDELYQLQNSNKLIQTFLISLSKHLFGRKRMVWQASDMYYIPRKHFEIAILILDVFFRHKIFLELAVPTLQHSLGVKYSNMGMAAYNWDFGGIRDKPWLIFSSFLNSSITFLHPVKLSGIAKNKSEITEMFCAAMDSQHFAHPFENHS